MSSYKRLFDEKNNQNWLKVSLGISLTKTALQSFVASVIEQFQNDGYTSILQKKCLLPGVSCCLCSTQNVLQCPTQGICKYLRNRTCKFHQNHTYRQCPSKICNDFREWIQIHHRFGGPSWRNSYAGRWGTDWWEIAKCYLPPDGYFGVHTVEMSDFNGLISIIINCKYFQNYFTDNLAGDSNVCTKVREIGRKLRHAPGLLVTDEDWKSCLDALKDLLQDPKYMKGDNHTKDAVDQLNKLEQDTLKVSDEEVLKVLQDSAETLKRLIEDSNIIKEKVEDLKSLEQYIENIKGSVQQHVAQLSACEKTHSDLINDMKEDLVIFYKQNCSRLPFGLHATNTISLVDIFVPPSLVKIQLDTDNEIGTKKSKIRRTKIKRFDKIFIHNHKVARRIYITAKAGVGKTLFCQFLVILWCAYQTNDADTIELFERSGCEEYLKTLDYLRNIEFLFFAHLKQSDARLCEVDDILHRQLINRLSRSETYGKGCLQDVMHKHKCLIILDGLDEWNHPDRDTFECYVECKDIPHERTRVNCTLLITSRPWKLGHISLQHDNEISIEIETMHSILIEKLIKKAHASLKKMYCNDIETEQFFKEVENKKMTSLLKVPLLANQMLCLWCEGHGIGESKCQVYCNTMETMFGNINHKDEALYENILETEYFELPACVTNNKFCCKYSKAIVKLGEIAFNAIFCPTQHEKGGQLYSTSVQSIVSDQEEKLALRSGLLSRSSIPRGFGKDQYEYSFLHKTYQEFFASIYMASLLPGSKKYGHMKNMFLEAHGKLSSEVFVFLCGLSKSLAHKASLYLSDNHTKHLVSKHEIQVGDIRSIQEVFIAGLQEANRNCITECSLKLRHVILNEISSSQCDVNVADHIDRSDMVAMCLICDNDSTSVTIDDCTSMIQSSQKSLRFVHVDGGKKENLLLSTVNLEDCWHIHTLDLKEVALRGTLDLSKCLYLSSIVFEFVTIDVVVFPATHIYSCILLSSFASIDNDMAMKVTFSKGTKFSRRLHYMFIEYVTVLDDLDLIECSNLSVLGLWNVNVEKILLQKQMLKFCCLGDRIGRQNSQWSKVLCSIQGSIRLRELRLGDIKKDEISLIQDVILSMKNLEILYLYNSDFEAYNIRIPDKVRLLILRRMRLSSVSLKTLVNAVSAFEHSVSVELEMCEITPVNDASAEEVVKILREKNDVEIATCDLTCGIGTKRCTSLSNDLKIRRVQYSYNLRKLIFKSGHSLSS